MTEDTRVADDVKQMLDTDTKYKAVSYIETYTGRPFFPLHPDPKDVSIIDIAHAQANQCRYSGHTTWFYCPAMEEPVLTSDLRWIPAGDLAVGKTLLGFDEYPFEVGSSGNKRRRFRSSGVTAFVPVKRRMIRLEFSDGSTVRTAAEHPWLAMAAGRDSGNHNWLTASEISNAVAAGQRRYMHRFVPPWTAIENREAGWLAGIADGEGSISISPRGIIAHIAQNKGPTLDHIENALRQFGFDYFRNDRRTCHSVGLRGGWKEIARFLGSLRPQRLLNKFESALLAGEFCVQMEGSRNTEPLTVIKCFDEPEEWCAGLETSSRTYLCSGFAAHNSTAQHCCLLADYVEKQMKGTPLDCLQILMHDAAEAYLADIPRPVKQFMPEFRVWDIAINNCIRSWLGLENESIPTWQDDIDSRIIVDERAQIMSDSGNDWGHNLEPLGIEIAPWFPYIAEQQFLMRYATYSKQIFGTHQYLRSDWGLPTRCVVKEFPFRTGGSDIEQRGDVEPKLVTDLLEVDIRGGCGRVAIRSPNGMMVRDTTAGKFPRPAYRWVHGSFELTAPGIEDVMASVQ